MNALSRKVVANFAFAFLTLLAVCGSAAFAQTRQGDYDQARREGASPDVANRRALDNEAERARWSEQQHAAQQRKFAEARASYEKQPPLPASRNPLLGKWQLQRAISGPPNSIAALGAALAAQTCADKFMDFRETVRADASGNTLDQVSYRGGGNRVAVLGTRGEPLMVFDFVDPNRIRYVFNVECIFTRVGPANGVAARAGEPATSANAAPAASARAAAGGGIANLGVNFGVSIDAVRQNLAARRVSILPARHNGNHYRLVADGEFSDIDPRIKRIGYEFDAPEGPAAKLSGVVITYTRDGGTQSVVYSERATAMSRQYPLAQQSPTQMQASVTGTTVSLIDDANASAVYEVYRVRQ